MTPARRRIVTVLVAAAAAADVGLLAAAPPVLASEAAAAPARPSARPSAAPAARAAAGRLQDPATPTPVPTTSARPVRVVIPAIRVDAALERLHRSGDGELLAPVVADEAGWWADGVVPGDRGPAVIAGHLDNVLGPAVFVDLRRLRPGDAIRVRMSDGSVVHYTVTAIRVVAKARFPSAVVYGATPDPQLRLITCNEPFDSERGSYSDNLVVFAREGDTAA